MVPHDAADDGCAAGSVLLGFDVVGVGGCAVSVEYLSVAQGAQLLLLGLGSRWTIEPSAGLLPDAAPSVAPALK